MHFVAKLALGVAAGGLFAMLGAWWILNGSPLPSIPPARTAAPEDFDATAYADLAALSSTERASVLDLNEIGDTLEYYTIPDLAVTYFILRDTDDRRRVIFLDDQGALIGDIVDQPQLFPMGHFLVTPDTYYEVTRQGVSARQPMREVTIASSSELEAMIGESSHYRSYSGSDVSSNDPNEGAETRVHVMRHNGTWTRVVSDEPGFFDWKGAPFHRLEAQYRVSRADGTEDAPDFYGKRYRVELTHFDQREFLPRRRAPVGSPTGQGRPAQWVGTGYYTIRVDGLPALRFRVENDREILTGGGPVHLSIHGGADLNFIVVEHVEQSGAQRLFVVHAPEA